MFRLWIGACGNWQPTAWTDIPATFVAIEPVDGECVSADAAAAFLEGYNGRMLSQTATHWAVAVPVEVRYQGDLEPGQNVHLLNRNQWSERASATG
jgi:hypothetical protein